MYPLPLPRLWEGIFTPNARCINTQGKGHEESHISDTSYTPYPLSHLLPQVHLTSYLLGRPPLRKTHKLRIPRPSIRADIILPKALLDIDPPRLIEVDLPLRHDLLDLLLGCVVETGAGIRGGDVPGEVEGAGGEPGFGVGGEGGREAGVEV